MNLRERKKITVDRFIDSNGNLIVVKAYLESDVNHHLSNFVNKIILEKNMTKGKVFRLLKEEFGEKK